MGIRYGHIAVCIDRSPASELALGHGVDLATAAAARLSVVHVGPYPLLVEEIEGVTVAHREDLNAVSRDWIRERAAAVPGAEAVFLQGAAGPAICAWAEDAGVDLLVLGSHRGWRERLLLGSVSGHVVNHAPCPVLVVRPLTRDLDAGPPGADREVAP